MLPVQANIPDLVVPTRYGFDPLAVEPLGRLGAFIPLRSAKS
jgi:hypothetical protein